MIVIVHAGFASGYSGYDHLITGRECRAVEGRAYRTLEEARADARRVGERNADSRVHVAPIDLIVDLGDGVERETR